MMTIVVIDDDNNILDIWLMMVTDHSNDPTRWPVLADQVVVLIVFSPSDLTKYVLLKKKLTFSQTDDDDLMMTAVTLLLLMTQWQNYDLR